MTFDQEGNYLGEDIPFRVDMVFGSVRIVQTQRQEGNKLIMGGYAIHYDRHGRETRRTPNEDACVLTWE